MNSIEIKQIAIQLVGVDSFYEEYRLLQDDLSFFQVYVHRNKKTSTFNFKIVPVGIGTVKVFEDILKAYGIGESFLEEEFAIYIVLRSMITALYNNIMICTSEQVRDFAVYLYKELGLRMNDYVTDFVDCSQGCTAVKSKISDIVGDIYI